MRSAWNKSYRHDISSSAKSGNPSPSPNSSTHGRTNSMLQRVRMASAAVRTWRSTVPSPPPAPSLSSPGERRVVAYLTSLRVVRKTFEDCRSVMSILRGFRVAVDERDLFMDSGFLSELEGILDGATGRPLALPRVFVGGRYIGGADEVRHLHETGELQKLLQGVAPMEPGVCVSCGGFRFILCQTCNGSRKRYCEKGGFKCCSSCNENGLVRCPRCCTSVDVA